MYRLLVSSFLGWLFMAPAWAQNLYYEKFQFARAVPPVYPSLQTLTTYDVRVNLAQSMATELPAKEAGQFRDLLATPLPYRFGKFTQVDSTGDLHIFVLVQRFGFTKDYAGQSVLGATLYTTIYDKFGTKLSGYKSELESVEPFIDPDRAYARPKFANAAQERLASYVQSAVNTALTSFSNAIYGYQGNMALRFAWLSNTKKFTELTPFKEQAEQLLKAIRRNQNTESFLAMTATELPFWESMTTYAGNADVTVVKRAALHNLALYHILKGDASKASGYLSAYKAVDRAERGLLESYSGSEQLEALLQTLTSDGTQPLPVPNSTVPLTGKQLSDIHTFYTINGTVILDGRHEGTYTGAIRIRRPEPQAPEAPNRRSGIADLGKISGDALVVQIETTDSKGKPKTITTGGGSVKSLKGADGTDYVFRKYGIPMVGVYQYLLRSDYQSPKVTVYSSVIPDDNEYVIVKSGDDKGVKSTLLNARKNVLDYLKECAVLEGKYTSPGATFDIKAVAQDYTNCR